MSKRQQFVIVTDSRGKTLDTYFSTNMLKSVDIRPYNGLTLNGLNERLPKLGYIKEATMVFFMVGINDLRLLTIQPTMFVLSPHLSVALLLD